jgi:hypothetical protein
MYLAITLPRSFGIEKVATYGIFRLAHPAGPD